MLYKKTLFLIFLAWQSVCSGQSKSSSAPLCAEIKTLVLDIANDNMLKSEAVGYAGQRTEQWDRFEKLKKIASVDELISLTGHENSVVRCYAFYALTLKKNVDIFPILLRHINDTARVTTFMGCIISSDQVAEYFLDLVTPLAIDVNAYKLSQAQRSVVDSILIFDKTITISKKYQLLLGLKPESRYYDRIREIAISEKNPNAIIALAKFKNNNDIELIKNLFQEEATEYFGIYSAREFPDTSFYPILRKIFEKEWIKHLYDYPKWRMLYQALARYPTQATYQLFKRASLSKDKFRYQTLGEYVLVAIYKYPNKIFDPIISKIKLDEFHRNQMHEEIDWVN